MSTKDPTRRLSVSDLNCVDIFTESRIKSCLAGSALKSASAADPFADPSALSGAHTVHPVHFYLALRASDRFYVEYSRWPGSQPDDIDSEGDLDMEDLMQCAGKVVKICTGEEEDGKGMAKVGETTEMACSEMYVVSLSYGLSVCFVW